MILNETAEKAEHTDNTVSLHTKNTFVRISIEPYIFLGYNLYKIKEHKIIFNLTYFPTISDFLFLGYKTHNKKTSIPPKLRDGF